jgi:hypothetical protein
MKKENQMKNQISRIASHVYVSDGKEAVKVYKDAFMLETNGEPLFNDNGLLVYQELQLNGNQFISVSDDKLLGNEKRNPKDINFSAMSHCVYFANEENLHRAFNVLYEDNNKCSGFREDKEGQSIFACDIDFVDRFGISWYFCVRRDWNAPDLNSPSIPI